MAAQTQAESEAPRAAPASRDVAKQAGSRRRQAVAYSVAGAITFFVVWWAVSLYSPSEFQLLPGPLVVAARMRDLIFGNEAEGVAAGTVFVHFGSTLQKTMFGFAGALLVGTPMGILMGRYRYAKNFFFDLVYLAANVPLIVYAILALILFGLSDVGPAVVVALLVLPIIALNVAAGVEGVDRQLVAMSRAYQRPASAALQDIVIPSFLPFFFAATRASFASSWKLATLAETFGGTTGVGVQIRKAFQTFSVPDMLAWMMFFVIFVVFIERIVLMRLERHVFRYRLKRGEDVLRY
jgi:NitT/TauT family transport system permease protein